MTDLVARVNPLVSGDVARDFRPRSDLTYRSYTEQRVIELDLSRSLLIGTSFHKCNFSRLKFDNCDIEGARFVECNFDRCTFTDADIRSCTFVQCDFDRCRFDQALLLDLAVQSTNFLATSFERASVHDSTFGQGALRDCSIKHASVLHNSFDRMEFEDIRIADCTFLYASMLNCHFNRVQLNAEAVGTIFGMSAENLASIELIYLGEIQLSPIEDTVAALQSSYRDRKWTFLSTMLAVNYGPEHRLIALNHALDALCTVARSGIGVKRDEFRFLARVAEQLSSRGGLPIGFLVHAAEETGRLLDELDFANVLATIQELHNRLYLLLQENLDLYRASVTRLLATEDIADQVLVTMTYRERPAVDSTELLRLAGALMTVGEVPRAKLVSARVGSWVEVIQTTALGAIALYAMLATTNGILKEMIRTRALASALVHPIPKRTVQTLVRSTVLRNTEPLPSRMVRSALSTLSDFTKRSEARDSIHQVAAIELEKLDSVSVELADLVGTPK